MTADVQRELAVALVNARYGALCWSADSNGLAAALLPTVQRLIADAEKRAAAAAVKAAMQAAATEYYRRPRADVHDWLWELGDAALDPAGAASGETT